jgi:hypothetical protein
MTSGWPQDQRDRQRPAGGSDDTGPLGRRRGRLATETGPQTPVPRDGSEFGAAHPSGPLPVGPMPTPADRTGRGRSRDGADAFGLSDADYDWIRYLGEAGPAQASTTRERSGDSTRTDRAALPQWRNTGRPADETAGRADGGPRHGGTPDSATAYLPRTRRTESGTARRHAAPPWSDEQGWPTNPPSPAAALAPGADSLTRPTGTPATRPADRLSVRTSERPLASPAERRWVRSAEASVAPPLERPVVQPTERPAGRPWDRSPRQPVERPVVQPPERPSGPAPRPDDIRVRGARHRGASHRRPTAAVDTGPEIARSPVEQVNRALRRGPDAGSRAAVQQEAAPDTRSVPLAATVRAVTKDAPPVTGPFTAQPKAPSKRAVRAKARRRHRTLVRVLALVGTVAIVPAAAAGVLRSGLFGSSGGPDHTISLPNKLLAFTLEPGLAKGMNAQALRADIVRKGNGEASHVVDGVYEDNAGTGAKSSALIILFIGGNLSGSASSFINSFTGMLPGAFTTSAGNLGGLAACVPGTSGRPAECAWADNDTFGLFASPALSASALGKDMRAMRQLVEHRAKSS